MTFQVRVHGRGGGTTLATAELLALAAFIGGRHVQVLPRVATTPAGSPATASCRIADVPIRMREPVYRPDAVIVQDATLREQVDVFAGLAPGGYALINSPRSWEELRLDHRRFRLSPDRTVILAASALAATCASSPQPVGPLLGAFAALAGEVSLEAVIAALHRRFPTQLAEPAVAAARAGYAQIRTAGKELAGA